MISNTEEHRLKRELVGLFGHMQQIRRELAALQQPDAQGHFAGMADQLDAIVEATEGATNTIMESVEEAGALVDALKTRVEDELMCDMLDRITEKINMVFEACSFQDITGQRINKVVRSMKFVEERVSSMVRVWGKDELSLMVVEINAAEDDPDKKLLNGPQRASQAISQDEIDKLFG